MAYVLTDGGSNVVTYPYNIGLLRRDNPSVSFPAVPTNAQLAEWNVYPVTPTPQPSYDLIDDILTSTRPWACCMRLRCACRGSGPQQSKTLPRS